MKAIPLTKAAREGYLIFRLLFESSSFKEVGLRIAVKQFFNGNILIWEADLCETVDDEYLICAFLEKPLLDNFGYTHEHLKKNLLNFFWGECTYGQIREIEEITEAYKRRRG